MGIQNFLKSRAKKVSKWVKRIFSTKRGRKSRTKSLKILPDSGSAQHALRLDFQALQKPVDSLTPSGLSSLSTAWNGPSSQIASQEFSEVQLSVHTRKAYQNDLIDFLRFLALQNGADRDRKHSLLANLNPKFIASYRNYLVSDRKLSQSSVTRKLAVLKSFFKYAVSRGWLLSNPAEFIKGFPQNQDSKTGFLNEDELLKLLTYLDSQQDDRLGVMQSEVLIKTLVFLGLRRSEAQAIRLGHLEFNDSRFLLKIKGKGSRERRLPLSPVLLDLWAKWLKRLLGEDLLSPQKMMDAPLKWMQLFKQHAEQPLFINTRGRTFDAPLSTSEMGRIVRKVGRKAGIVFRLSPHMLRATAITSALDSGATHRGVQQMAGWTSPLMISRYDKRLNDPKFSAVYSLKYAGWPRPVENVKMAVLSSDDKTTLKVEQKNDDGRNDQVSAHTL